MEISAVYSPIAWGVEYSFFSRIQPDIYALEYFLGS
jgi:hypothetical protein